MLRGLTTAQASYILCNVCNTSWLVGCSTYCMGEAINETVFTLNHQSPSDCWSIRGQAVAPCTQSVKSLV